MAPGPPVVVYPPADDGGRRVRVGEHFLGMAYGPLDVADFLQRAGVEEADRAYVEQSHRIEWRGGGPDVWAVTRG
ncbi:hypothetical protein [Streptomyces tropicalis]|uniref:Uncharacterized protein n=1 Tax=Streptomyces tropicalis TaxID=3034234 RepID=A0ABT6A9Z5_9ACTN|nr:hypothetical protein [Streptomyces tropicalis]MDF3301464.1 hypothetical protein [Streptomyces tropicalis]